MAICPSCGKVVDEPSKVFKNYIFKIEGYDCGKCHNKFRITANP